MNLDLNEWKCSILENRDMSFLILQRPVYRPPGEAGWVTAMLLFLTCTPTGRLCVGVCMCGVCARVSRHAPGGGCPYSPLSI